MNSVLHTLPLTASVVFAQNNQGGYALKWLPAHFNVEDKLSQSPARCKRRVFIYALSADETSPAFVVSHDHKYSLFSCCFKSRSMNRVLQHFHSNADRAYNTLHFAMQSRVPKGAICPFGYPHILAVDDFAQHDFFSSVADAIASSYPFHLIVCFQFLGNTLGNFHLLHNRIQPFLRLLVHLCKI